MKTNLVSLLKNILSYCPTIGFMVVLSSLLFPYSQVQQIALIFTGATYVLDYVVNQRWQQLTWSKQKWVYVLCILFFLLFPLWILLGIEIGPELNTDMETYLPFAILGVVGILGMPPTAKVERLATIVLATVSVVVVYIVSQVGVEHLFDYIHSEYNLFNSFRKDHITSHMHFNLYANMALVLGVAAISKKSLNRVWRIALGVMMIITIVSLGISDGRVGILTMLVIVGLSLLHLIWKRNRIIAVVVTILGVIATSGILLHSMHAHYANLSEEPRQYIWAVAVDMIKEHPWRGYGPSNGHELFVERGMQDPGFVEHYALHLMNQFPEYGESIVQMTHPHNVFLETTIAYGMVGGILLLLIVVLPVVWAHATNRWLILMCQLTFFIQGMFEKMGDALNPLLWLLVLLLLLDIPATCSEQSDHH